MKWFICIIGEILATIIAYLTNPIVCLFCDERGNLPRSLYWWQTFDNCLDIDWMVYEHCVPKFAEYDFNKHYKYHLEQKFEDFSNKLGENISENFLKPSIKKKNLLLPLFLL